MDPAPRSVASRRGREQRMTTQGSQPSSPGDRGVIELRLRELTQLFNSMDLVVASHPSR
jgi:hypothetical protein